MHSEKLEELKKLIETRPDYHRNYVLEDGTELTQEYLDAMVPWNQALMRLIYSGLPEAIDVAIEALKENGK